MKYTVPTVITCVVKCSQNTVNYAFLGHLDNVHLIAGVGMGNVCLKLGSSVMDGLTGALNTLVSQAYGAGNIQQCGVYLNKARFVTFLAFIPVVITSQFIERLLVFFGQDAEVAYYAQLYIQTYLPGKLLQVLFSCQCKFLNM
jgi:MATE family multidrug resistance protein